MELLCILCSFQVFHKHALHDKQETDNAEREREIFQGSVKRVVY